MSSKSDPEPFPDMTDPWGEIQLATIHRDEAKIAADKEITLARDKRHDEMVSQKRTRRHETIMEALEYGFYAISALAAAAVLCAIVFAFYRGAQNHGRDSARVSANKARAVEACTRMENPIERQYCLIQVTPPPSK